MTSKQSEKMEITGASFSIHIMSDDFKQVIKDALVQTNATNVWLQTDDVTTVVRGKTVHVFDVTKAILYYASESGAHVSFHATYSFGCPGDSTGDIYLETHDTPVNVQKINSSKQYAAAKFSLYPLTGAAYMNTIYEKIETMKEYVKVIPVHYATKLEGNLFTIFAGLEKIFQETIKQEAGHTVMTVDFSVNSPSHD